MRHFSLFEYLSYGEEFWNDVEGRAADRPTCPFCHLEGLEKEEREVDHRTDVWRCRNCQHRVSDDDLLRVASIGDFDDEEPFITIDIQDSLLGGIFDVLTLGQRMDWIAESEADDLFDYLDYVYGNAQEMGENIVQLKLDADNYEILKRVFSACKGYSKDNELWREIIAENEDLDFIDIGDAWVVFNQAETSPSSAENLEAIPTMENKDAPVGENAGFGNCPWCGIDAVDPDVRQCQNCGWDQDNACPECFSDRSLYLEEDGSKHCNNCGWNDAANQPGALPPATPAGKEQTNQDPLEQQYNLPSAEHPLGPHTGSNQELYTSGGFVKSPDGRWLVAINPSGGQRDPEPGDWATIQQRTKSFNRPVPLTLVEDMGGAWKFRNGHHPNIESQVEDETL